MKSIREQMLKVLSVTIACVFGTLLAYGVYAESIVQNTFPTRDYLSGIGAEYVRVYGMFTAIDLEKNIIEFSVPDPYGGKDPLKLMIAYTENTPMSKYPGLFQSAEQVRMREDELRAGLQGNVVFSYRSGTFNAYAVVILCDASPCQPL